MENQSQFDIETAIQRWRQDFKQSPAVTLDDLVELEGHLRESIQRFEKQGLTPNEAFFIATRRLGGLNLLEPEFGKDNASAVWLNRTAWMLVGIQLACTLLMVSRIASGGILLGTHMLVPANSEIPMFAAISAQFAVLIALIFGCWRILFQKHEFILRVTSWASQHLALSAVLLMVLSLALHASGILLAFALFRTTPHPEIANVPQQWTWVSSMVLQVFILPIALAWLARKRQKVASHS